eukprot:8773568-Karenia_brevis.AAC.1
MHKCKHGALRNKGDGRVNRVFRSPLDGYSGGKYGIGGKGSYNGDGGAHAASPAVSSAVTSGGAVALARVGAGSGGGAFPPFPTGPCGPVTGGGHGNGDSNGNNALCQNGKIDPNLGYDGKDTLGRVRVA